MRRRLTLELVLLRAAALGALILLLVNPARSRPGAASAPPLVLLDASLSMTGAHGVWRAALDSARHLAVGGLIWRFGDAVSAFDTTPPAAGRSRLEPALAAAAGRSGPIIVVTDGAIGDAADLPSDLRRRSRILVLPRAPFLDAFVVSVDGPRRVAVGDTVRLRVAYGTAGKREGERGKGEGAIVVRLGNRRLASRSVPLPDSGVLVTEIAVPTSLFPLPGLQPLEVALEGSADDEPRDDARWFVLDVSPQPTAVVLASPPGWEARFFTKTLADVARVPVKLYVETEPDRWRDAATLAPVPADVVRRAASGARLVALIGAPDRLGAFRRGAGILWWPLTSTSAGDWYVDPPPPSVVAGTLAGVSWDSLPPATAVVELSGMSATDVSVLLTARLARRGPARPLVLVRDSAGTRQATVTGAGLWRWGFRGGAPAEAYRALVAAVADWLLAERSATRGGERFGPLTLEASNGMPLEWRWLGREGLPAQPVRLSLEAESGMVMATLHFDADARAELRVPPGRYRWRAIDGPERGVVVVERYSDEWRPTPVTLTAQPGAPGGSRRGVTARDQWWLFAIALAAFVGEWAWRRRRDCPDGPVATAHSSARARGTGVPGGG